MNTKKWMLILLTCIVSLQVNSQTNKEISEIYFKRASLNYDDNEIESALKDFSKGYSQLDSLTDSKNAKLGALIYFRLEKFEESKKMVSNFFRLSNDKSSFNYKIMLELYVTIEDKLDQLKIKQEKELKQKLVAKRIQKKKDSLKLVWNKLVDDFCIVADTIYPFNKHKHSLFVKDGVYGVINDQGKVVFLDEKYKYGYEMEGYFILLDKKERPSEVHFVNSKKGVNSKLPYISEIHPMSSYYKMVMPPIEKGVIVLYPNNTDKVFYYDLNNERLIRYQNQKDFLKKLKDMKVVDRYRKENEIFTHGEWYKIGGFLNGGGILPLFNENQIKGYLFSSSNKIVNNEKYKYLGILIDGKIQALNKNYEYTWLNNKGQEIDDYKYVSNYSGSSNIIKHTNKAYVISRNEGSNTVIINDTKTMLTLEGFIKKHL